MPAIAHTQPQARGPEAGAGQAELRYDYDGRLYAREDFQLEYGGLHEWEAALTPAAAAAMPRRGQVRTRAQMDAEARARAQEQAQAQEESEALDLALAFAADAEERLFEIYPDSTPPIADIGVYAEWFLLVVVGLCVVLCVVCVSRRRIGARFAAGSELLLVEPGWRGFEGRLGRGAYDVAIPLAAAHIDGR